MPVHSSALLRVPSHEHDAAASVCFQTAGQVVTVLGKIDRHFDEAAIAGFAKQAVAEYAAKQQAQVVAVTIMQDAGEDSPDDAQHFTHDGQHYAITIGNLADERTRMDHLTRVMERLKYLQAVMVMLSTTDMLGTSQALGKHMGGMTARLQQVQKIGLQLEKLTSKIEEAKKRNQPLSQKISEKQLTTLLMQMQKLQTGAPPELRRVLQTMMAQVKELRQLPALGVQPRVAAPLKVIAKQDAAQKTGHRFNVQPAKLALRVVEGGRVTQQISQRITLAGRVMPNTFRIPMASVSKIAAQIKPANDNRFRTAQTVIVRIESNATKQAAAPAQIVKASVALPAQRRFSVLSVISKLPAALATTAAIVSASIMPVARQPVQAQIQPSVVATSAPSVVQAVSQPVVPVNPQAAMGTGMQVAAVVQVSPQASVITPIAQRAEPIAAHVMRGQVPAVPAQRVAVAYAAEVVKRAEVIHSQAKVPETTVLKTQDVKTQDVKIQAAPSNNAGAPHGSEGVSKIGTQQNAATSNHVDAERVVGRGVSPSGHQAVPVIPAAPPVQSQSQPPVEAAKQPIIQQYKQAAQDFGERISRGAQDLQAQVKQRVEGMTKTTAQQVSNMVDRVMPEAQSFVAKVNSGISNAYQAAAAAACAAKCAALAAVGLKKADCGLCDETSVSNKKTVSANRNTFNKMKLIPN